MVEEGVAGLPHALAVGVLGDGHAFPGLSRLGLELLGEDLMEEAVVLEEPVEMDGNPFSDAILSR